MRVFLDACVVIYLVEHVDPWFKRLSDALGAADVLATASQLVRLECRVGPLRAGDDERDRTFERFFRRHGMSSIGITAFEHATRVRAEHNLKTPDALHIGAAIAAGCDEFWTNDHRLDRVPLPLAVRVFED